MTREEIITAIKNCKEKLGRAPTMSELCAMTEGKLDKGKIGRKFGGYKQALGACGLTREDRQRPKPMMEHFINWAKITRRLKKIPTVAEFNAESGLCEKSLRSRFKSWRLIPVGMLRFMEREKLEGEWGDVAEIIREHLGLYTKSSPLGSVSGAPLDPRPMGSSMGGWTGTPVATQMAIALSMATLRAPAMDGRPLYGEPIRHPAMANAPTNEMGVMVLFGALAGDLGFVVLRTQAAFPDCEALRRMDNGRMQRVLIEFEFESKNFLDHLHDPKGCDLIVCWKDGWTNSPVEVIELSRLFGV